MNWFNVFVVISIVAMSASARAQHSDVRPHVRDGRIVTGAFDDSTSTFIEEARVFGYDFGEVIGDPFFAADPGFNAAAGSGLPADSQVRFNILGDLQYWSGSGDVVFGGMPGGETLRLSLGAQSRRAGAGTGEIAAFSLGTVGAAGTLHVHLNSFLQGSDGNADPSDGFPPAEGIYLVPLELVSSDAGVADSLPFWVVFNNGLSEEAHDRAIGYVESSVVPEPGAGLMMLGVVGLVLRRRRA